MLRNKLCHVEHRYLGFTRQILPFKFFIRIDVSSILLILKIVLFECIPKVFFTTWVRGIALVPTTLPNASLGCNGFMNAAFAFLATVIVSL